MRINKKLIIIISIIVMVAVVSTVLAYLIVATDVFKSDKELFAKYIAQNATTLQKMTDSQTIEVYQNLKNENKYESNTNIKITHSEGGEVSNPLNNLAAKIDLQKDNEEQYIYADGQILYANEEYLQAEIIKQEELYGIRFSDVAKQFVTVKQDENFEKVANSIGINSEDLAEIINIIDGTIQVSETLMSQEETTTLEEKYLNVIKNAISQGTFYSLKNAMITYNNETIKTNSYTVELSNEQVENLVLEVLNSLKTETIILEKVQNFIDREQIINEIEGIIEMISEENEIPAIKITVYERKEQTIRTVIEIGMNKIVLENSEENAELKTKIQLSTASDEQAIENNIEISKKNTDNQENYNVTIENRNAEENFILSLVSEMTKKDNNIVLNVAIGHEQDITTQKIMIENTVKIAEDFEKIQTLEQSNNVVLNDMEEARQVIIINLLKENLPTKVDARMKLLQEALTVNTDGLENDENSEDEEEISQTDINKFNSKFEFYTGEEVSAENVKTLLGIVKDNISAYEISPVTNESGGSSSNNVKYNFKLYIEQNQQNEDAINNVLEKIDKGKKYKILISYKEENGLIDYITINEVGN